MSTDDGNANDIHNNINGDNNLIPDIEYAEYTDESMLPAIMALVTKDLSEPYSIFTYRYFLHNWPKLCLCAYSLDQQGNRVEMVGTLVCKAEGVQVDRETNTRSKGSGYIAMLAVNVNYRKKGIGMRLVKSGIERMAAYGCDEITLEAEMTNTGALNLYEKLGFVRDEKLGRYYLNGGDAYRLKLWIDKRPSINLHTESGSIENSIP